MVKRLVFLLFSMCLLSINTFAYEIITPSSYDLAGYFQLDYLKWRIINRPHDYTSGTYFKNSEVCLLGRAEKWEGFLKINFLKFGSNSTVEQVFARYKGENLSFKFGKLILPFSLEEATDVGHRVFVSNSLLVAEISDSFLGVGIDFCSKFYNFFITVVTPELDYRPDKYVGNSYSSSYRCCASPINFLGTVIHLGVNYRSVNKHAFELEHFPSVEPIRDASALNSPEPLLVSHFGMIDGFYAVGFEVAANWKIVNFQYEYSAINAIWHDFSPEIYQSWYAQLSCYITGEHKVYERSLGRFSDPKPRKSFGAFELAMRCANARIINKDPLLRGAWRFDSQKFTFSAAVNWHINSRLKFQINYGNELVTFLDEEKRPLGVTGFAFRLQFIY